MQFIQQLTYGNYYHIYNHGVGERDLFYANDNYHYFLDLYYKYISPVANTFAWVLMKNHFHLLVQIKEEDEIIFIPDRVQNPVRDKYPVRDKNINVERIGSPSLQFLKLFNAYAQAINKRYGFRGALFERPFKRKLIDNEMYLKQVLLYVHNNPVHHGFCRYAMDYPWSSYLTCISTKPTQLFREDVISLFDNVENFKSMHSMNLDFEKMEEWLEL